MSSTLVQSPENINMLNIYIDMNEKYSIHINNNEIISSFSDYSRIMLEISNSVRDIVATLNAMIPKKFNVNIMQNYKTDMSDLAHAICDDISIKLNDGILSPMEVVHAVMGALNNIGKVIKKKTKQLKHNTLDIKYVLTHFVLSLLIIILSSLTAVDVINENDLKIILKEISVQLETYRLIAEMMENETMKVFCSC